MGSSAQWPPLEQVREWAEFRLASGQSTSVSTGRYRSLIAIIDEILVAREQGAGEEGPPTGN